MNIEHDPFDSPELKKLDDGMDREWAEEAGIVLEDFTDPRSIAGDQPYDASTSWSH